MNLKDFIGGTIKGIWMQDDIDKHIILVATKDHGRQGLEAVELGVVTDDEEDYEDE